MTDTEKARRGDWMQTFTGRQFWPLDFFNENRLDEIDLLDIAHHLSLQCRFAGATKWHYSVAQHSVLVSQCAASYITDDMPLLPRVLNPLTGVRDGEEDLSDPTHFRHFAHLERDPQYQGQQYATGVRLYLARWGLLHDAAEAYLQDVISPLKRGPDFDCCSRCGNPGWYPEAEERLMGAICLRFDLPVLTPNSWAEPDLVKLADTAVLLAEKRDVLSPPLDPTDPEWFEYRQSLHPVTAEHGPNPQALAARRAALTPWPTSTIPRWSPERAEAEFLARAEQLGLS